MNNRTLTTILTASLLTLSPTLPAFDLLDGGAAYADSSNKGGGSSGGNGGGNGKSETKSSKSEKSSAKAEKSVAKLETKPKKKLKATEGELELTKGKPLAEGELAPKDLGKMNGAMHANINAVLAHIRNGQTTNGPVGLLAGLAVADAGAAGAAAAAEDLLAKADAFTALEDAVTTAGFGSVEEYLQAKADGTATQEQIDAVDPLIEGAGGTTADGLALAETPPTDEEIAAAEDAAEAAQQAVTDAETAIGEAWNKDGELPGLLTLLRERLAPHQDAINATIEETEGTDDLAGLIPEVEEVIE